MVGLLIVDVVKIPRVPCDWPCVTVLKSYKKLNDGSKEENSLNNINPNFLRVLLSKSKRISLDFNFS